MNWCAKIHAQIFAESGPIDLYGELAGVAVVAIRLEHFEGLDVDAIRRRFQAISRIVILMAGRWLVNGRLMEAMMLFLVELAAAQQWLIGVRV